MAGLSDIGATGERNEMDNNTNNTKTPQENLTDLIAQATAKYAVKDYTPAAELYSQATELQAEINGEMSVENAELLYAYGRCLFFVAQRTSTVLGGTAAQVQLSKEEKKLPKKRKINGSSEPNKSVPEVTETSAAADVIPEADVDPAEQKSDKPYFQFQGDENWENSSDEDEEEAQDDEEDDDFATSFELLDLARILFGRKIEQLEQSEVDSSEKGKSTEPTSIAAQVKEVKARIADIYDLQAEISLEGEKYSAAVSDLKSRLLLNEELEAPDSEILAECHYKLSLALEAAAQDQQRDADGNPVGDITINWDVRNEAISHQQKAIDCCKLRLDKEKKKIESLPEESTERRKVQENIEEVQEICEQMQDRLTDLKKPPVSAKAAADEELNKEMMAGVLGKMLASNASKAEQKETLAKVIAGANDLSGMVKKKRKAQFDDTASNASGISTGSKRKVQFVDPVEEEDNSGGKKAKVEDAEDSGL